MSAPKQLNPFTSENAAEMGRKGGLNKRGAVHLSTLIRRIGENIDWSKTSLENRGLLESLFGRNAWEAIVYIAIQKALEGDAKAMEWLAKNGYGIRTEITGFDGVPLDTGVSELKDIAGSLKRVINDGTGASNGKTASK